MDEKTPAQKRNELTPQERKDQHDEHVLNGYMVDDEEDDAEVIRHEEPQTPA